MDETRRNLIKGMLSGGTLLALGIPGIAQAVSNSQSHSGSTRNCQLLLGNTPIGEAFARGAVAACTTYTNDRQDTLPTVQLADELLASPLKVAELLKQSRNIRWIAVMDDASAAIFTELVRNFEGRLLSRGSHTFSSGDGISFPLRHVWATASPAYSAGELLASRLVQNQHNFSIVENFLDQSAGDGAIKNASLPGFLSYRLTTQPATHLHCAGVSALEAGQLIGWKTSENWQPTTYSEKAGSDTVIEHQQFDNWVETTGYAIVATALGMGTNQESCASRAFVHRSAQHHPGKQELAEKHFVSFVIDV